MQTEPYASAERVFWIVDNGSSHRGQSSIDRLSQKYSNAILVHTPVHASWLNQIEIYFSIGSEKFFRRTTSPRWRKWKTDCWPFKITTCSTPAPSTGSSTGPN